MDRLYAGINFDGMRIIPGLPAPALLLILLSVATILSCKKDHHGPAGPCKIIGYYDTVTNRGSYSAYYTALAYDEDDRISSALIGKKDSLSVGYIFNYSENRIVVTPISTNGPPTDTVILNSKGLPVTVIYQNIGFPYNTHSNYFYSDSVQLRYIVDYDQYGKAVDTVNFHYTDGDLTSKTYSTGYSESYSYYTDKPASDAEFSRLQSLINTGFIIPSSKHMLKSIQATGYWANYNYTFDGNGRIVSGVETFTATGGILTKRTYVYDCSQ